MKEAVEEKRSLLDRFVFMDKANKILDVGLKTSKNVILYGPGGHGKSDFALEYLYDKGINPYIITMGSGMTTERLFGGINIPLLKEGKIEYLVENSFMNHEFVILEEMMDAPDFILEQLKDTLSSGFFRNGTQVFPIKTQFIICCTNKTREEYAKNDSIKALMERFPLELNVIWDNYNETSYNTLLQKRFGEDSVDPIIPFILEQYAKNGITISPRIALDAYDIYQECGPDSLMFIADFCKKANLITETLKKFEATVKFKELTMNVDDSSKRIVTSTDEEYLEIIEDYTIILNTERALRKLVVSDDLVATHTAVVKKCSEKLIDFKDKYHRALNKKKAIDAVTPGAIVEALADNAKEQEVNSDSSIKETKPKRRATAKSRM